jgi:hypothetical protein
VDPELVAVPSAHLDHLATLERVIDASLDRIWENVLDWEHLPWLHDAAFERIERVDSGSWGWRARLCTTSRPGDELTVELRIEREALRYVTRTLEGQGAGTEIWTQLEPRGEGSTAIHVEFWLPGVPEGLRDRMGKSYVELYQTLWSEDEEMMRLRESRLAARPSRNVDDLELGPRSELLSRLPLLVEAGGGNLAHRSSRRRALRSYHAMPAPARATRRGGGRRPRPLRGALSLARLPIRRAKRA